MESQKCVDCGLMNWVDRELCKRCETPLRKLNGQPNITADNVFYEAPRLLTINFIGTRLMGWRHHGDGTGTTTVWFTALFLPIFPISRHRIVSPTKADFVPKASPSRGWMVFAPWETYIGMSYLFLGRLPLSGEEVLRTYLFAYLWLPIKLIAPLAVTLFALNFSRPESDDGSLVPILIGGVLSFIWLGYVTFVMGRLMHRSKGGTS